MRICKPSALSGPAAVLLLLLVCFVLPCAAQQTPSGALATAPVLRIETGMHGALIGSLGTDAKNKYVVTGSSDKTVRVWDGATGAALGVIRPPIGGGSIGQVYAVAISPDGKTVACGGWTGDPAKRTFSVDLFDRATGRLTRRLDGLPSLINALAFSPQGDYLAAVLGSGGLRVFKTADGSVAGSDAKYGSDSYGVAWAKAGDSLRLATTCFDGKIRLYAMGAMLKPLAQATVPANVHAYGAAFSPDGAKLAVGFYDARQVLVLSGADLTTLYTPDANGVNNGSLSAVCWSADGQALYAAGRFQQRGGFLLRRWADGGQGVATDTPLTGETLLGLQPRQSGGVFFCAGDPAWGAVGDDNNIVYQQESRLADFRDNTAGFLVSSNGTTVQFGTAQGGKEPAQFSLTKRVYQSGGRTAGLVAPVTTAPGLDVQGWRNGRSPTLNGQPLALDVNEMARCLAVAPDNQQFVLGTEWNVRCFDANGKVKWSVAAPGTTWAVNVTPNGKSVLAAFADGTIRWYRLTDGQELCALFPHADHKRWVLWTPSGYYDCSPGGENLVGWHLNHGPDQAADFFPASRFRDAYYRPVMLAKVLDALGEAEALRLADAETGRKPASPVSVAALPPVVTILAPDSGASVSTGTVTLRYSLRTPSGQPITSLKALVDGRPALTDRDLKLVAAATTTPSGATREISVPVPPRDCVVSLVAENSAGAGAPALVSLVWAGAPPTPQSSPKPKLYVLAVGISKYNDTDISLTYPDKDAQSFSQALLGQKGQLYDDVQERVLLNGDATRDKIRDGLAWLDKQTTARDVAIIFLAGHGANDPSGRYLFVPADFDRDHYETTGVPFSDIKHTVESLPGKTLLFVDSCHSGNVLGSRQARGVSALPRAVCPAPRAASRGVDVTGAINELSSAENGAVVFAASTGNQVALEDPQWGHGAFTKALLEAFAGKADFLHRGRITVNMIDLYVSDRVKELTDGAQTPTTAKPQTVPDFPVALDTSQ